MRELVILRTIVLLQAETTGEWPVGSRPLSVVYNDADGSIILTYAATPSVEKERPFIAIVSNGIVPQPPHETSWHFAGTICKPGGFVYHVLIARPNPLICQ